ncbi:transposase [Ruminococcus flavefaciens]|uniref:transposase n=1 Tax=uncultured Ruminococcus sp. TaxID=165186 RepID=UPI000A760F30|nr:transposase [Ruminococcus flavefaciens]
MEEANRNAKFWAGVLNSLRNRGVEDILIAACTDNLTGSIKQPYLIRYGCI